MRPLFLFFMLSALVAPAPSTAQYNEPKPVKRMALVIGNAEYDNADKLPGSLTDARTMAQNLRDAGFDVTLSENVRTRDDFLGLYLPFVTKIDRGSFAVFYYSGHGFTYGGEGFLTPTTFPKVIPSTEVQDVFLSVSGLQDLANSRNPALLLLLLDACRNIPDFIVEPGEGQTRAEISKGFPEFARNPNNVLGYSSRAGTKSIGDGAGGLSKYTAALNEHLMKTDVELLEAHRLIALKVKQDTNDRQSPWMSTNATPYVYFKMSKDKEAQALTEWIAAQKIGEPYVRNYAELWGLGPYAASARKWLTDNSRRATVSRASHVSPAQVDASWDVAKSAPISIPQVSGPLAMPRIAADTKAEPPPAPQATGGQNPQFVAEVLASSKTVVVMKELIARFEPKAGGGVAEDLKPGAKIEVQSVEQDDSGGVWLRGKTAESETPVYVQVPKNAGTQNVEIGRALREFTLGDAPLGTALLGDTKLVVEELARLKLARAKINWVSIATPTSDRERSTREKAAIRARAYYVAFLIGKTVPPENITMVEEAADLHGENPRIRIFGSN
ncbi:caspase family protein [Methylocystis sp.]|uniref:caspase family protein n=1 Tax=Methylocystis sp. TaxID=1911079 RepID=UPI0025FF202A|nr:caspase family protein [Methylocystis sp.]